MPRLDWERIARAEVRRVRLAILGAMAREPPNGDEGWSAKAIAAALDMPLATVSHHVRALARSGLLGEVAGATAPGCDAALVRAAMLVPGATWLGGRKLADW